MSEVKKEDGKAVEKAPVENKEPQIVVGTNPLTIPWPQDQQGALASLKKGGIEAAKRVNRSTRAIRRWRLHGMPMGWEVRDGQRVRVLGRAPLAVVP